MERFGRIIAKQREHAITAKAESDDAFGPGRHLIGPQGMDVDHRHGHTPAAVGLNVPPRIRAVAPRRRAALAPR
jgi:hypothetical protein